MVAFLKQLEQRVLPGIAVILALLLGYTYGLNNQGPLLTQGDVKKVVLEAVVPVRNDVRDLALRIQPPVVVTPVKTETIEVAPAKPKAKKKAESGFFQR